MPLRPALARGVPLSRSAVVSVLLAEHQVYRPVYGKLEPKE